MFSTQAIVKLGIATCVWAMIAWGIWLGLYFGGEFLGILTTDSYFISKALFHVHFTNPHRIFIVPPIGAAYVVVVVIAVRKCFSSSGNREVST